MVKLLAPAARLIDAPLVIAMLLAPKFSLLVSSLPPTLVVPAAVPASKVITPFLFCNVCAEITPVLLTTLANKLFLAPALITTIPPSAWIICLFSARLFSVLWSICNCTRLLFSKVSVAALPAPKATVPNGELIVP